MCQHDDNFEPKPRKDKPNPAALAYDDEENILIISVDYVKIETSAIDGKEKSWVDNLTL